MNKALLRCVALLLVPCLLADPVTVSALSERSLPLASQSATVRETAAYTLFQQQAIPAPVINTLRNIFQRNTHVILTTARLFKNFPYRLMFEPTPRALWVEGNTVSLKDRRKYGYQECGDPNGVPVLYFPSWPSSRLEQIPGLDTQMKSMGIRFVVIDPPGAGTPR